MIRLVKGKKYDLVYAHDYYTAIPLLLLKRKKIGIKYVYDAHELYIPVKNARFSKRDWFFYYMERKSIKEADLVICAQEDRAIIMKKHYKLKNYPTVIRNISRLANLEDKSIAKSIMIKYQDFFEIDAFTIVYAGVVTNTRKIDRLIEAIVQLGEGYKLLIIGDGDSLELINTKIEELNTDSIISIGSIPYSSLYSVLRICDIGYIYYPTTDLNNIYCAPNKIYEYASVGLPIISNENPTVKKLVDKYEIGLCNDNIKSAIEDIAKNYKYYKEKVLAFDSNVSWENERKRLNTAIDSI